MKYKLEKISKFIDFVLDGLLNFDDLIKLLMYFYIIDNDYLLLMKIKILFIKIYVKKKLYINSFKNTINNYNSCFLFINFFI